MPIKPELRWFYPIDWPQISHWVRFVRAKGRCQVCGRPHGAIVRIWAMAAGGTRQQQTWRDGRGRKVPSPALAEMRRYGRPRWCWRPPISTTIPATAAAGIATSKRSASAAICCTTGRSIGGGSG